MTAHNTTILMSGSIKIPESVFKSFQAVLMGEAKRLCKDVAKALHVPEKDLIEKVLTKGKMIPISVVQTDDAPLSCPVLIESGTALVRRCRKPCLLGTGRCCGHQDIESVLQVPDSVTSLTRLAPLANGDEPLWCNEETGEVYAQDGSVLGEFRNGKLTVYSIREEEDEVCED